MIPNIVNTIDVHELKKRRDSQSDLCIIDVREQDEWDEQHIPGAIHIPKDKIADNITGVTSQKNHPIYLHCRGGTRSLWAGQRLIELGYTDVYSIDGGITAWIESGYPAER